MVPQSFRDAVTSHYGGEAHNALVVRLNIHTPHTPLGWGVLAIDSDSASSSYGLHIIVDPRFVVWIGGDSWGRGEWRTPRWFEPRGQQWSRAVLGDFGS
jgi:hypothetical protein